MFPVNTSCRSRLNSHDFEFIATVLTGAPLESSSIRSLLSDPGALDDVLDLPKLFQAILDLPHPLTISPALYFYVLVRHNLKRAGMDDIEVADYVAATLCAHASGNPVLNQGGAKPGTDFTYHLDFMEALDGLSSDQRFFLQVNCANQFLVLTGLFPRFLRRRKERRGAPGVRYYEGVARNAFLAAGEHPLALRYEVSEVYERLADQFGATRRILNKMAEEYLFLGA